ncbi:MAG: HyaD/HybD family hydrogenase maturation endopeptidase [Chromatiales bacterium]|nr:HyaD/HybD family hydrogenase maturation endopeptidase [Chromatiales bacterium]
MRVLIIGLGNVLMRDEGIGVRAAEELESRYHLPEGIEVVDGGTSGTELLEPMRGIDHLFVADAINTGAEPGTIVTIADEQVPAFFQTKISNHQLGLSDLLAVLRVTNQAPKSVTIVGMVPYVLENELGLSPAADKKLDEMVDYLVAVLAEKGIELKQRAEPKLGFWAAQERGDIAACA